MINVDLQQLVSVLDDPIRNDLESCTVRCVARGGVKILVEDLLLVLLERVGNRLECRGVKFEYSKPLVTYLHDQCTQDDKGALRIDRLLDSRVTPLIADRLLLAMFNGLQINRVHATLDAAGLVTCELN